MNKFEADIEEIRDGIIEICQRFLIKDMTLTEDQIDRLNRKIFDIRKGITSFEYGEFDINKLFYYLSHEAYQRWIDQNLDTVELWKKVAIENASVNNEPYKVANDTIEAFNKTFEQK